MGISDFELCKHGGAGADGSDTVIGVTVGSTATNAVLTLKLEGITVYDTKSQVQLYSWPLGASFVRSEVPAVYDRVSECYYGVVEADSSQSSSAASSVLLTFKSATAGTPLDQLPSDSRQTLAGKVHSLICSPGGGVLIITHDATVQLYHPESGLSKGTLTLSPTCNVLLAAPVPAALSKAHASNPALVLLSTTNHVAKKASSRESKAGVSSAVQMDVVSVQDAQTLSWATPCTLSPPSSAAGSQPVAATCAQSGHLCVLWSGAKLASYCLPTPMSTEGFVEPTAVCHLESWEAAAAPAAGSGASGEASRGKAGGKSKKRSAGELGGAAGAGGAGLPPTTCAAIGGPFVALAHAASAAIQVAVVDTQYGCIHEVSTVREEGGEQKKSHTLQQALGPAEEGAVGALCVGLDPSTTEGTMPFALLSRRQVHVVLANVPPLSLAGVVGRLALGQGAQASTVEAGASAALVASSSVPGAAALQACTEFHPRWAEGGSDAGPAAPPPARGDQKQVGGKGSADPGQTKQASDGGGAGCGAPALQAVAAAHVWDLPHLAHRQEEMSTLASCLADPAIAPTSEAVLALLEPVLSARTAATDRLTQDTGRGHTRALTAVLQRCVELRMWEPIRVLIADGQIYSLSLAPQLLGAVLEAGEVQLLPGLLQHLRDLPPAPAAHLLHHCLRLCDQGAHATGAGVAAVRARARSAARAALAAAEACPPAPSVQASPSGGPAAPPGGGAQGTRAGAGTSKRVRLCHAAAVAVLAVQEFEGAEVLLHALLAGPMDGTAALHAVRHLAAAEALVLLQYLHKWALLYLDRLTPGITCQPSLRHHCVTHGIFAPSLRQVLDFVGHAVDAHFAHLSLLPNAHKVLASLHEVVQRHVAVSKKMRHLLGPCKHILDARPMPTASTTTNFSTHYSIEMLTI